MIPIAAFTVSLAAKLSLCRVENRAGEEVAFVVIGNCGGSSVSRGLKEFQRLLQWAGPEIRGPCQPTAARKWRGFWGEPDC